MRDWNISFIIKISADTIFLAWRNMAISPPTKLNHRKIGPRIHLRTFRTCRYVFISGFINLFSLLPTAFHANFFPNCVLIFTKTLTHGQKILKTIKVSCFYIFSQCKANMYYFIFDTSCRETRPSFSRFRSLYLYPPAMSLFFQRVNGSRDLTLFFTPTNMTRSVSSRVPDW